MPGMSPGPKTNHSNIVATFRSALLHQGLVVLLILAVAGVTLNVRRTQQFHRARGDDGPRRRGRPGAFVNRQLVDSLGSRSA